MNKKLVEIVIGMSIAIIGILAIVSCVPGEYVSAEAASSGEVPQHAQAQANAASQARWEGLGQKYIAPNRAENAKVGAADAARWEAKGASYDEMAKAQLNRGQEAAVARWQAIGVHFSASDASKGTGADLARWVALGESYQAIGQTDLDLSADVARWVGLGECYK